jgi:serine/threonine protein kinase
LAQDLATFQGELDLSCPACRGGAVRLLLGAPAEEAATVPPARDSGTAAPHLPASPETTPPAYSTDDEVEAEEVDDGPALPGDLRQYELLGELGRGGMGVVYKARQKGLKRVVALKMILAGNHAGPEELERFRVEAEAIARLRHPNVVQVYEIGEHDGLPFFSLEFCAGGSLEKKLRHPLPPREAAGLLEVLARAVQAAHDAGVIHRDLKPANVLFDAAGSPRITDFGLAKKLDEAGQGRTRTGAVMGTPSYMAPEQAGGRKDIGPPADVYALGAVLYCCLTGRPPFQAATTLDTILQLLGEEPVPPRRLNSKVPRDLNVICLKSLQKGPNARYARAADLADDLRRYLDGDPIRARPPGMLRRTWKAARKKPVYALVVLLLSAGVILGVVDYARARQPFKGFSWDELGWILKWFRSGEPKPTTPTVAPVPPAK